MTRPAYSSTLMRSFLVGADGGVHRAGREALGVDVEVPEDVAGQADGVGLVVDREAGRVAQAVGARGAGCGRRPSGTSRPTSSRPPARRGRRPGLHLGGGLVGEGDGQEAEGRDAPVLDQVGDAVGEHPGLARAGAGDDQQRTVAVDDGLPLRGVQPLQELVVRRHPLTLPTPWDTPPELWPRFGRAARSRSGGDEGPRGAPLASPLADGRIARLRGRVTEGAEWAMTTAWQPVVIARAVYERDRDIGGGLLAGAIAFRLFVWLAAFVVVLVVHPRASSRRRRATPRPPTSATAGSPPSPPVRSRRRRPTPSAGVGSCCSPASTPCSRPAARWCGPCGRPAPSPPGVPVTKPPLVKGVLAYNGLMLVLLATIGGAARLRDATPGPGPGHHPRLHRRLPRRHLARHALAPGPGPRGPGPAARAPSSSPWGCRPMHLVSHALPPGHGSSERRRPTGPSAWRSSCCSGSTSSAGSSSPGVSSTPPSAKSAGTGRSGGGRMTSDRSASGSRPRARPPPASGPSWPGRSRTSGTRP